MRFRRILLGGASLILAATLVSDAPGQQPKKGEVNTPPARGERIADKLRTGDVAPNFTLPFVSKKGDLTLADFKDKKPVVLIFGSYT